MLVTDLSNSFIPYPKNQKGAGIGQKSNKKETVTDEVYNAVLKRDKGKCRLCGTNKDLHLHHIKGRGKDLTNNIENCIMLCQRCHLEVVHKNQKHYRPILLDLIKGGKNNGK